MLRRLTKNIIDLKGIYELEKLRHRRKKMPGKNIEKLYPQDPYDWCRIVQAAAECLRRGGVIAVPTDTLYGLCTLIENSEQLYRLKRRSDEKPLGIFVHRVEDIEYFAHQTVPNGLLKNLFPGPVTVLFNRSDHVPTQFNPGVPSIGFRVPQARFVHDICQYLPFRVIAQTSANVSGSDKNPICIEDFKELWNDIDMIVDGGPILENNGSRLGSTIVDLSIPGQFKLLRAGCAELETTQILREFGLKTPEEFERLEEPAVQKRPELGGGKDEKDGQMELNGQQHKTAISE